MDTIEQQVRAAVRGDLEAYGLIVRRFQDMAIGYAFSLLGDFHLAEDAAQEAFVQAHRDLSNLREAAAFPCWFRRILFKQSDRLRRNRRAPVSLATEKEVQSQEPDPASTLELKELQARIHRAIASLPASQREVTMLYYISDYSQQEIADFLGISLGAVKKRLQRAREGLRERMLTDMADKISSKRLSRDRHFVDGVLEVIAPDRQRHTEKILALFEMRDSDPGKTLWRKGRMAESKLDWQTSRIACIDDVVVAVWGIYDLTMRIGGAHVRVAGANLDKVHSGMDDDEGKDLLEKTAREALQAAREQGYDMSVTFFDERFTRRLGFTRAWRALEWWLSVDDLPSDEPDFELHEFTLEYTDEMAALFNAENERLTGTTLRPTYLRGKAPETNRGYYWTDPNGRIAGFVTDVKAQNGIYRMEPQHADTLDRSQIPDVLRQRFEKGWEPHYKRPLSPNAMCLVLERGKTWLLVDGPGQWQLIHSGETIDVHRNPPVQFVHVDEAVGDPDQILKVLGHFARQCTPRPEIHLDRLPPRSRLGQRLLDLPSCRVSYSQRPENAYMIQILNLRSLFEALAPELATRLADSSMAGWRGDLAIACEDEEISLQIRDDRVEVCEAVDTGHSIRGGQEIARLVVGVDVPCEVVKHGNISLSGDAVFLVESLFPRQDPQMRNQAL